MKKNWTRAMSLLQTLNLLFALSACGETNSTVESISAPVEETSATPSDMPSTSEKVSEASQEEVLSSETPIDSSSLYPVFDELTTITAFLNIAP